MMFHYRGCVLGAIRYEGFKIYIKEGRGGLPRYCQILWIEA